MPLGSQMAMFGGANDDGTGSPSPRGIKMPKSKKMSAADTIEKIASNDPSLTECADLANSTIFAMKSVEYTEKLCAALSTNTHLVELDLSDCGLNDANAAMLAEQLAVNTTLLRLNLNKNKIKDDGCAAIARSLAGNITLREIELFGNGGKWGEGCLIQWLEMYKTNVTLLRINWSTSSKSTVTLTKMLARNTDINRALGRGEPIQKLLPSVLQESPPDIQFYKLADVTAKRGGVGDVASLGRQVGGKGKVMRNGVEDVAAAPGSVAARLAAMRAGGSSPSSSEAPPALPEPAPAPLWSPEPAPAPASALASPPSMAAPVPATSTEPIVGSYTCVKKSQIRCGFEMDSDKAGILNKNVTVHALEIRINEAGVNRMRINEPFVGWVSEKTGAGGIALELIPGTEAPAPAPPPAPAPAPAPPPPELALQLEEESPSPGGGGGDTGAMAAELNEMKEELELAHTLYAKLEAVVAQKDAQIAEMQVRIDEMAAAADRQQDFEAAVEQEQGQHIERLEEQVESFKAAVDREDDFDMAAEDA